MAISYVGGSSGSSAGGSTVSASLTALTGGSGSAPLEGDIVIATVGIGDADGVDGDITMNTAGYTEVLDQYAGAAATDEANQGVYYKFMTATPDLTAVGNNPLGADSGVVICVKVFRGVKAVADGGPWDATPTATTGTGTGDVDPPSIDLSGTAGVWTVVCGSRAHVAGTGLNLAAPTNYVSLVSGNANDTTDISTAMAHRTNPADPEDPGVMIWGGVEAASQSWCVATLALAEAAAIVNQTVNAVTVAAIVAVPLPAISVGVNFTPPTVASTVAVPLPEIQTGTPATVSAVTVAATTSIDAPEIRTTTTVLANVVAAVVSIPVAAVTMTANVATAVVEAIANIFTPTVDVGAPPEVDETIPGSLLRFIRRGRR